MYVHIDNIISCISVTVPGILLTLAPWAACNNKYNCYYFCHNTQGAKANKGVAAITAIFFLNGKHVTYVVSLIKCQ
jgi:hypothetical protein